MIWCFPIFLIFHTSDIILGHIPLWLRFIDLHGVACLSSLTRYTLRRWPICYLIMILWWSLFKSNPHFSAFRCHRTSSSRTRLIWSLDSIQLWIWIIGIAYYDGWPDVVWFFDLQYIWCHIRAYFSFDWDLQIFMELHTYPHLRDTCRDDDLLVILSWFPSGVFLRPFN